MKCGKCGAEVSPNQKFCTNCGARVHNCAAEQKKSIPQNDSLESSNIQSQPVSVDLNEYYDLLEMERPANDDRMQQSESPIPQKVQTGELEEKKVKNRFLAGLLGIFLGCLGAQWFYLGKPVRAVIYIIISYTIMEHNPDWIPLFSGFYILEAIFMMTCPKKMFIRYAGQE